MPGFYESVTESLRVHPAIQRLGFRDEDIAWYGRGADHQDLMQITRTNGWMIHAIDAEDLGYKGVWVHYESCRPGHWCIHCELFPRLSPREKAAVRSFDDLLDLKAEITMRFRSLGEEHDWPMRFGAHLKRARKDVRDPSSLIVWTFETGLGMDCSPDQFVEAIVPVIEGTTPLMDEFLLPLGSR